MALAVESILVSVIILVISTFKGMFNDDHTFNKYFNTSISCMAIVSSYIKACSNSSVNHASRTPLQFNRSMGTLCDP